MSVIDAYLAKIDEPQRAELERIRQIVKLTLPEAEEVITYGMPGFNYKQKYLVSFNALKDHLSLFPAARPIEQLKDKLQGFSLSKGTIRFTLDNPLPESLIKEIIRIRAKDITNG
jgi:uncharacterized protein YdhG (YjbR/CyaY superfamily)